MEWVQLCSSGELVPSSRANHGVSVIGDQLYVFGGDHDPNKPIDNAMWTAPLNLDQPLVWRRIDASDDDDDTVPEPRVAHAQCANHLGIFVFGGFAFDEAFEHNERPLQDFFYFETLSERWVKLEPAEGSGAPPSGRSFHKMTATDGQIYVFGGCAAEGRLADLHCFDLKTHMWTQLPSSAALGRGGAGFVGSGDNVFVVAGYTGSQTSDVHRFDTKAKSWECLVQDGSNPALMPSSVACGAAVMLESGIHIVMVGGEVEASKKGHDGAGSFTSALTAVVRCELGEVVEVVATDSVLSPSSALRPEPRGWSSADSWRGNKLVLFGGLTGDDEKPVRLNDVWCLRPQTT